MMGCSGDAGGGAGAPEEVHVALGRNLRKGKVILEWVLKNLRGKEVIIVHVHKPPKLIPMKMGGKFPVHMAAKEEAESYIEAKRAKMNSLLHSYIRLCAGEKISAKKLVIETEDVYEGIVYLVGQHQINRLVMGLRSIKGQKVLEEGLLSCQILLVHNGKLVFSREALLQQISIEFTGDENQGDSASSPKSAKATSSPKSAKETLSLTSAKETSESHESHQDNAALRTSGSWSKESAEESRHCCSAVEEIEAGSSKEDFEAEDMRDLLAKLAEAVHVVYQQRLELARQILELKQEFIDFSLPELEAATNQLIAKNKNSGMRG